jgi:hypothetical protein
LVSDLTSPTLNFDSAGTAWGQIQRIVFTESLSPLSDGDYAADKPGIFKELEALGASITNRKHFNNVKWSPKTELRGNDKVLDDPSYGIYVNSNDAQDPSKVIAFQEGYHSASSPTQQEIITYIQKIKAVSYVTAAQTGAINIFPGSIGPVLSWSSLGKNPYPGFAQEDVSVGHPFYDGGNQFYTDPWFISHRGGF